MRTINLLVFLAVSLFSGAATRAVVVDAQKPAVDQLIQQLGAPQYAQREKARERLQRLGVVAFEALHEAQFHADVEIRKQATYLLRTIRISWVRETDSDQLRLILANYHNESREQRLARIEQLGRLEGPSGVKALCRLARFETSEDISKRAALKILRRVSADESLDAETAAQIRDVIGPSRRAAARWLLAYAVGLNDPNAAIALWRELCQEEIERVQKHPDKYRIALVQELIQWRIEMLQRLGHADAMLAAMQQMLSIHGGADNEILVTANWLIRHAAWPLFAMLVESYDERFEEQPFLKYRRAEAERAQGNLEVAETLVQEILAIEEPPPYLHVQLGYDLQMRGLVDWAEREYRQVVKLHSLESNAGVEATVRLGWMFHDLGRHQDAYEAYVPLVELMADKTVIQRLQENGHQPMDIQSQMHFSHGLWLGEQQAYDQQREALDKAIRYDGENADILIAMYRVPQSNEDWKRKVNTLIETLRDKYEDNIRKAERGFRSNPGRGTTAQLAQELNQHAWLVSNTFGDYHAALKNSQRSLELRPNDGGYLDTLARCYFALGNLEQALIEQRKAVEEEPNSGQIKRQLEYFETQLKQRAAQHTGTR